MNSPGQRRAGSAAVADDGLEELRVTFFGRLQSERQVLRNLDAVLTQGKMDRVPVLDELRSRAHRLSGTAAILDLREVSALARVLELAVEGRAIADRALSPREENSDRVMHAALQAFIDVIDSLSNAALRLPPPARIATSRRARRILAG
jgi:HPt (histidine-containing phosphotransfer) domain-containing protein